MCSESEVVVDESMWLLGNGKLHLELGTGQLWDRALFCELEKQDDPQWEEE